MIPEEKDHIILHLMENNYLNEERFSKAFARGKFKINKWGKIKITNELKFKNISPYNIKTALKEIDIEEYYAVLLNLTEKKNTLINESNAYKRSQKLSSYLISKGYEFNLVFKAVKEVTE